MSEFKSKVEMLGNAHPFSTVFQPLQMGDIKPHEHRVVFEGKIPKGYVGRITDVGNNMYVATKPTSDFYYRWLVDGEEVEKVSRIIGDINQPYRSPRPIIVRESVKWECVNETDSELRTQILVNGYLVPETSIGASRQ